jgi:predicted SnoaL-like aldol condensation-catalyzing enzyme
LTTSDKTEANKALVVAAITGCFVDRDPAVLDRLFSPKYRQHNPLIPDGPEAIKAMLGKLSKISSTSGAWWSPRETSS